MENFAPGLRDSILTLTEAFRFVLFFICVTGLMLQVHHARAEQDSLTLPIVRAIAVVGLIATLPQWFQLIEKLFLALAEMIHEGYAEHPMRAAVLMRDSVADSASDFSFQRIGESLYRATLFAAAKLIVLIGSLLQLPFLVLQFILKLLCYLFLPVALATCMVPSLANLGTRYVQQTLAILSWPIGFAVTELVAYHLLTAYATNLAAAYDLAPGQIDTASFASLLGGLLAALWLLIGTLGTPFLMVALIAVGYAIVAPYLVIRAYRAQERVVILDGGGTFHVSPLLGFEESGKLHEYHALLACLALWQRNPAGADFPELLEKLFLPDALRQARTEIAASTDEFARKSLHQKAEVLKVGVLETREDRVLIQVEGQWLRTGLFEGRPFTESVPFKARFTFARNPNLGGNARFPLAVWNYDVSR